VHNVAGMKGLESLDLNWTGQWSSASGTSTHAVYVTSGVRDEKRVPDRSRGGSCDKDSMRGYPKETLGTAFLLFANLETPINNFISIRYKPLST
jgi:hypothetical protein